jgi:hypothetical protein
MTRLGARRAALMVAVAAVAAAAACTLNPQPLPPADLASNGSPDGGPTFSTGPADAGSVPELSADAEATSDVRPTSDSGGIPPTTAVGDAGDAGDASDGVDAGDGG